MKKYIALLALATMLQAEEPKPWPCGGAMYITHYLRSPEGLIIGFQTVPNLEFEVQTSTNLVNWTTYTNFVADGFSFSCVIPYTNQCGLVRIKANCP
jgi:hypothetical protein